MKINKILVIICAKSEKIEGRDSAEFLFNLVATKYLNKPCAATHRLQSHIQTFIL